MTIKNKKRLLVTGACGFFGSQSINGFKNKYEVSGLDINISNKIHGISYFQTDITNQIEVKKFFEIENFDIILHCAAIVNPDFCEENYSLANEVNVIGTKNLVQNFKGLFIYISTDMLFDGYVGDYKESDKPNPINNYGKTKYDGEKQVQQYSQKYYILRTNFYGWNDLNTSASFAEWIYTSLSNNEPINLFYDYIYCPIYIEDFLSIIHQLIQKNQYGIYNVVGQDKVSKYDFGILLAKKFGLKTNLINRTSIEDHKFIARRPKNMSLNTDKLKSLKIYVPNINEGMQRFFNTKKLNS